MLARSRMLPTYSSPPGSMVSEMTRKVAAAMSSSMRCVVPGDDVGPLGDGAFGRRHHGRHVAQKVAVTKQRRHCLPLPAPVRSIRGENAVAEQRAEHALLERRLGEAFAAVEQHALDQVRIGDPRDRAAVLHDRLVVDVLGQHAQRVAHEGEEEPRQAHRRAPGRHRRRVERGGDIGSRRESRGHGKPPSNDCWLHDAAQIRRNEDAAAERLR